MHEVVSPVWEDWSRSLDKWGGTVTHAQFRDVVRSFATESPLTDQQVWYGRIASLSTRPR